MDRKRFDALTRLLATTGSRRDALAVLVGWGALAQTAEGRAKPGQKQRGQRDRRNRPSAEDRQGSARATRGRGRPQPLPTCCGAKSCSAPARNSNRGDCNLAAATFAGLNAQGSNLQKIDGRGTVFSTPDRPGNWSRSDLSHACLHGARFGAANLLGANFAKSCLIDADFAGARIDASTNFSDAVLCRTTMPDGSVNDSGCPRGTPCCPACDSRHPCPVDRVCCNGTCHRGDCCSDDDCSDPRTPVCRNHTCSPCTGNGQCGKGEVCCDGSCLTGVCCSGRECAPGGNICDDHRCFCGGNAPCAAPHPDCCGDPGACTDTRTDPDNCGACGRTCAARECNSVRCAHGECIYALDDADVGSPCGANSTGFCFRNDDGSGSCLIVNDGTQTCVGVDPCTEARSCGAGCICYTTIEGAGFCITGRPGCNVCPPDPTCFNRCADAQERPPCAHSFECGSHAVCVPLDGGGSDPGQQKGCCAPFSIACGGDYNQYPGFCVPITAACQVA